MGYSRKDYLRWGRKKESKRWNGGWTNGYVKPATKFWKRQANKKVRKTKNIPNGGAYKIYWGWHEWC